MPDSKAYPNLSVTCSSGHDLYTVNGKNVEVCWKANQPSEEDRASFEVNIKGPKGVPLNLYQLGLQGRSWDVGIVLECGTACLEIDEQWVPLEKCKLVSIWKTGWRWWRYFSGRKPSISSNYAFLKLGLKEGDDEGEEEVKLIVVSERIHHDSKGGSGVSYDTVPRDIRSGGSN